MGAPGPTREPEIWWSNPSQNMQLQVAAKPSVLCCHLANAKEQLVIPPFAKLPWSLLIYIYCTYILFGEIVKILQRKRLRLFIHILRRLICLFRPPCVNTSICHSFRLNTYRHLSLYATNNCIFAAANQKTQIDSIVAVEVSSRSWPIFSLVTGSSSMYVDWTRFVASN